MSKSEDSVTSLSDDFRELQEITKKKVLRNDWTQEAIQDNLHSHSNIP